MKKAVLFLSIIILFEAASCSEFPNDTNYMNDEQIVKSEGDNYISEDELLELMDRFLTYEYYTAYESMEVNPLQPDESGTYFAVINEDYDTWEEWTSFCESIFCDSELIKAVNGLQSIKNVDGKTYCMPGSIGFNISKEYDYNVVESTSDRAMVQISRLETAIGEESEEERVWFFDLLLTNEGWRIIQIVPFS